MFGIIHFSGLTNCFCSFLARNSSSEQIEWLLLGECNTQTISYANPNQFINFEHSCYTYLDHNLSYLDWNCWGFIWSCSRFIRCSNRSYWRSFWSDWWSIRSNFWSDWKYILVNFWRDLSLRLPSVSCTPICSDPDTCFWDYPVGKKHPKKF